MNKTYLFAGVLSLILAACSGDDGGKTATDGGQPPLPPAAPGGLYVGYYQEDPATNPEDPMLGTLFLNLPEGNAKFSGRMSFTYVGCQTANVGTISGDKTDVSLDGDWTGTVDGLPQKGKYKGTYDATRKAYSGTYDNSQGKQYRDLSPCITYHIAPNGSWELFAANTTVSTAPNAVGVVIQGNTVTWYPPGGTQFSVVSVLDRALALSNAANAIVLQDVVAGAQTSYTLPAGTLVTGRSYVISAGSSNGSGRTYYSSKEIVAP